jgi:hypothetical protein
MIRCGITPSLRLAILAIVPDDVRTLSEPLPFQIAQRDTSVSGSGSDRAVRRKPVVRSEQDVWGYGFSTGSIIGDAGE